MASLFTQEKETMEAKGPIVHVETNLGNFDVQLYPDVAPKACENFLGLAQQGYYNGTIFHRIIPSFMIQGGDPSGNGTGGNSIWGKKFQDECTAKVQFDRPGLLAMANAGPNTNGSQFFITTAQTPWLNMHHTIFGEVIQGQEVIKKIEAVGSRSGSPSQKVQIVAMRVDGSSQK